MFKGPRLYNVHRADRVPLVLFMVGALEGQGCRILYASEPTTAPFVITFETSSGERLGVGIPAPGFGLKTKAIDRIAQIGSVPD